MLICEKLVPFKGEPLKLFKKRLIFEGYYFLIKSIEKIILNNYQLYEQHNLFFRNLKHSEKPADFIKAAEKAEIDFDKYSYINGESNIFFICVQNSLKMIKLMFYLLVGTF